MEIRDNTPEEEEEEDTAATEEQEDDAEFENPSTDPGF